MMDTIKVGIIGGAGFAAGELIRLLLNHSNVIISFIHSESQSGKTISTLHPDLEGECDLRFTSSWDGDVDVLFLCRGHGYSKTFIEDNPIPISVKIIDLSTDFRLKQNATASNRTFVYGLPELNRHEISESNSIANPGCFATAITLALLPMANHIQEDVHVNCITGSTGAGQNLAVTSLFSWRDNNISSYKVFEHQHLAEILETLSTEATTFHSKMYMVPIRGNFSRGIFTTLYTRTNLSGEDVRQLYRDYYAEHSFVHINGSDLHLKKVVNTNKVYISIRKHGDMIFIESVIDNLMKGASGQAVQNMNIMFGIEEATALRTKASVF